LDLATDDAAVTLSSYKRRANSEMSLKMTRFQPFASDGEIVCRDADAAQSCKGLT
jgi:hypothetical protein